MFTPKQYRAKAVEYGERIRTSTNPNEKREFRQLEGSFAVLADNEQWLKKHQNQTVHAAEGQTGEQGLDHNKTMLASKSSFGGATLAADEEHILRCLGGALIMQWNTLPTKLRKELFDDAAAMGELLKTEELRGKIARFLHKHKAAAT
jgi:hypothetical protein